MTTPPASWDLCILIRRPPYGSILGGEALRHLAGAISQDLRCVTLLLGEGVWLARAAQDPGDSGWPSLAQALQGALTPAGHEPPLVLADAAALKAAGLQAADLVPGVACADEAVLRRALVHARHVLIF